MNITLADPSTLHLSFTYNAATVAQVKALPGSEWDKETKTWAAPLYLLRRLVTLFPGATVESGVIIARLAMWRRWIVQHNHAGIWFALGDDLATVIPTGAGVSPLFVEYVAGLSGVLAQFLGDQVMVGSGQDVYVAPVPSVQPTQGDRVIWTGIVNAKRNEERKAAIIGREKEKRRAGRRVVQATIYEGVG